MGMDQDEREAESRERSEELLARTEMSPEEQAEHEARARRNKIDRLLAERVTWDPANPRGLTVATMSTAEFDGYCDAGRPHLPATQLQRTGEAASGEIATRKWVVAMERDIAKVMAKWVVTRLAPLRTELEQATKQCRSLRTDMTELQRINEVRGDIIDKLGRELAELKREAALAKRLEESRNVRRVEALEIALIAAGRNPAEIGAETDIPKLNWNGHAS